MRYAIQFKASEEISLPINNQHIVNSFVHNVIGRNNKFHDAPSSYNISGIFGASLSADLVNVKIEKGDVCTFIVSSQDSKFNESFYPNLLNHRELLPGLELVKTTPINDEIYIRKNVFRSLTPILLKEYNEEGKSKFLTISDPEFDQKFKSYVLRIIEKNCNLHVDDLADLDIIVYDRNKSTKLISIKGINNVASHITFEIKGDKTQEVSRFLYDNGIGVSRGSGFGMIVPNNKFGSYVQNFFKVKVKEKEMA